MFKKAKFLKEQKILRLATVDGKGRPHLVPVWYDYSRTKLYIGTNAKTKKARNVQKNGKVCFCVDDGVRSPIHGIMGSGKARLILQEGMVKKIAKKILLRYFKNLESKSAKELLDNTDCIIEITPGKITTWEY